jgi:hypothetical protein
MKIPLEVIIIECNSLLADHPCTRPVTMSGLYQTPTKKTILQWEFSSPDSGLASAMESIADHIAETTAPPLPL